MVGEEVGGLIGGALFAMIMGFFVFFAVIFVALWVYTGLAFSAIAKKDKQSSPGFAWIPIFGPLIVAYKASGMHWWPWLLLIGSFIPFLNIFTGIAFFVFFVIWQWKMFEAIGKPGWWAILCIISPINLIMWGIAAWSKD